MGHCVAYIDCEVGPTAFAVQSTEDKGKKSFSSPIHEMNPATDLNMVLHLWYALRQVPPQTLSAMPTAYRPHRP
jgi:hypothetical protein